MEKTAMVNFMPDALKKLVNPVDVKKAAITAEQIVSDYLQKKNYSVERDEKYFKVKGEKLNFLVQVKLSVAPKTPAPLSSIEEEQIKAEAGSLGFEAWEAKVTLDKKMHALGEIQWQKIS
jgi:predicted transcriptional regulator